MSCSGLPKSERLRKRSQFLKCSASGLKIHSAHFIVLFDGSALEGTRVGFTVSKKVGNAVARNAIKRRLREFYRQNKPLFTRGDFNIVAKRGAEALGFHHVSAELAAALERLRKRYA